MPEKSSKSLVRAVVAVSFASAVFGSGARVVAQTPDPCSAIVCLGGLLQGGNGGPACGPSASAYFSIQVWSPAFNPPATAAARQVWLEACPAGPETQAVIAAITETYGPMLEGPTF
jgi:hypothetical protein